MSLKKHILMVATVMCILSCSKSDEGSPQIEELTLETTSITVVQGESANVKIESGNSGYVLSSYSCDIASAQIVDNSITITGVKPGETTLEIKDRQDKKATLKITVISDELTLDKYSVTINEAGTRTVTIKKGNGGYTLSSFSTEFITAAVNGNTITIKGVKRGETTITVKDRLDNSVSLEVKVIYTPTNSTTPRFVWESISLELEKTNGWGTTIFPGRVSMTNISEKKQYLVKWSGDLSLGAKSGASIVLTNASNQPQTITLTDLSIVKVDNERYWIVLTKDDKSGELVFTR